MELTEDSVSDVSQAKKLLKKSQKISKVEKGFMDGAYDKKELWGWCEQNKILPFIRLRKNAKPHGLNLRAVQAKRMNKIGFDKWFKERGWAKGSLWNVGILFSKEGSENFLCVEKNRT